MKKSAGRVEVVAGRQESNGDGLMVAPLPVQGSASYVALVGAEGFIVLPSEVTEFARGDPVDFVPA